MEQEMISRHQRFMRVLYIGYCTCGSVGVYSIANRVVTDVIR